MFVINLKYQNSSILFKIITITINLFCLNRNLSTTKTYVDQVIVSLKYLTVFMLLCFLIALQAHASPRGDEFGVPVSRPSNGLQTNPATAMDDKGNYVVQWTRQNKGLAPAHNNLTAQYFTGKASIKFEIQAAGIKRYKFAHDIDLSKDGSSIVTVWSNNKFCCGFVGDRNYAMGQFISFDQNSSTFNYSSVFQIDDRITNSNGIGIVSAALDLEGNAIIAYDMDVIKRQTQKIYVRKFDKNGIGLTEPIAVTDTPGQYSNPKIALTDNGAFLVIWEQLVSTQPNKYAVYGRLFNNDGTPASSSKKISSNGIERSHNAEIDSNHEVMIITWQNRETSTSDYDVLVRKYDANFQPISDEFKILDDSFDQRDPSVTVFENNNYEIVWQEITDKRGYIRAARFMPPLTQSITLSNDPMIIQPREVSVFKYGSNINNRFQQTPVIAGNGVGQTASAWYSPNQSGFIIGRVNALTVPIQDFYFSEVSDHRPDEQFSVTITARDPNFFGEIDLGVTGSTSVSVSPDKTNVLERSGGKVGPRIQIDKPFTDVLLKASASTDSGQLLLGTSNVFNVIEPGLNLSARVSGKIVNSARLPRENVTVDLCKCITSNSCNKQSILSTACSDEFTTGTNGEYAFSGNLNPGNWFLAIQDKATGLVARKLILIEHNASTKVDDWVLDGSRPPVILVPGIMGSTRKSNTSPFPGMPKAHKPNASELKLHGSGFTGFNSLEKVLEKNYSVYKVPYDWRMSIKKAWPEYLQPIIEQAKRETGFNKVHVVAHSMGGLLTRAYIQDSEYQFDIDKFLMLGTPNFGSPLAYVIVEGADPQQADYFDGSVPKLDFYCLTVRKVYKDMENETPFMRFLNRCGGRTNDITAGELRTWLRKEAPGTTELLPIYTNALESIQSPIIDQQAVKKLNPVLLELNQQSTTARMSTKDDSSDPTKVKTLWMFSIQDEDTAYRIKALADQNPDDDVYSEGEPNVIINTNLRDEIDALFSKGDGTVPPIKNKLGHRFDFSQILSSIDIFGSGSPISVQLETDGGEHAKMPGQLSGKIKEFLDAGTISSTDLLSISHQANLSTTTTSALSIYVEGSTQPLLTDSSNNQTGKLPGILTDVEGIPNSTSQLWPGSSSINILNPNADRFDLDLEANVDNELATVMLSWSQSEVPLSYQEISIMLHQGTYRLPFSFDSTQSTPIQILPTIQPPSDINIDGLGDGRGELCWKKNNDSNVAGYRIYSRRITHFKFDLLKNVSADTLCYSTGHEIYDGTNVKRQYVVVSTNSAGDESPIFEIVSNRDLDLDNDGVNNLDDAFPNDPNETVDTDGDGVGNNADTDDDNDGVLDSDDAFPLDNNESVDTDGDGVGNNADTDDDNDGLSDDDDNCSLISNPDQTDTDADGYGNVCDLDDDEDGILDDDDNCPLNVNPDQLDSNLNGVGDVCEPSLSSEIELVSISTTTSIRSKGSSSGAAVSKDGRFVVFTNDGSNFDAPYTGEEGNVYLRDRLLGTTEKISQFSDAQLAERLFDDFNYFYFSSNNSISDDGRFVTFGRFGTSGGSVELKAQVYLRDRELDITTLISTSPLGELGTNHSLRPSITSDGRYIAFSSSAENLTTDDTNGHSDIFLYDTHNATTERVTQSSNGDSYRPSISANGNFIAFISNASNLVSGDSNQVADVFIYDRINQQIDRVNISSESEQANGNTTRRPLSLSENGRFVAFHSNASNLVSSDTNNVSDIFVRDRRENKTIRVSKTFDGQQSNDHSYDPSLDASGRFVVFHSSASNLVNNDTNNENDVFIHDLKSSITKRVSLSKTEQQGNSWSSHSEISDDAKFIAFTSEASNLVDQALSVGEQEVFVTTNPLAKPDINVDGAPSIDKISDSGWFIWRENGTWVSHFLSGTRKLRYIGSIHSESPIDAFEHISIESNDVLEFSSTKSIDFKLNIGTGPYRDGFKIFVDELASTCVSLVAPDEMSIYLGPDRIKMPNHFDLLTLQDCKAPIIETVGRPVIDRSTDRGVFLWENSPNRWQFEFVPGVNYQARENIVIDSSEIIEGIQKLSLERNDLLEQIPTHINLELKARAPWYDGLKFTIKPDSNSCFSKSAIAAPLYVGPNRIEVGNEFNLIEQGDCQISYRADVNGDGFINSIDANLVGRYGAGLSMINTGWIESAATGDVDCDGNISLGDLVLISRFIARLDMSQTAWCIR